MAETVSKARRQKVEEKERAILSATRAVYRDKGAEDVKIARIAHAAKLAEGTDYLCFKNKQALLLAADTDFYEELTGDAEAAIGAAGDTHENLAALARLHFARVREEWPLIAAALGPCLPASEYRDTAAYALNRRYVAVFDGVIREGMSRGDIRADISVSAIRDSFYGGLEHLARSARLRGASGDADHGVGDFLTLFTTGLTDLRPD